MIHIYTDGSSRGNPGPGGFGVILMYGEHRKELSGAFRLTTNNRMELMAVIVGLEAIKNPSIPITIHSDSKYVVDTIEQKWLQKWIASDFKGKRNRDLWVRYHDLSQKLNIRLKWVKGHADNSFNNRCDILATTASGGKNLEIDTWYEKNK